MIEVVTEHLAGSSVRLMAYVKDDDDALVDPTAVNVVITDPDGSTVQASTAMTNDSTGVYSHIYLNASTATLGWYRAIIDAVDGSGATAIHSKQEGGFRLK